ncbi:hypothetical protein [Streptomyces sp. NPDC090445]|uniref:hypothetical protein n=1 Tax=Streptomyces sp. NPDC090445 TaxID=3365963 RepID=UPI0038189B50
MHVQESRISVRLVEYPIYYPETAWTLEVGELEITSGEILAELGEVATLHGQLKYPASHELKSRESQTSWGASGSFGEYLLDLSVNAGGGLGAIAFSAAIKITFDRIRARATYTPPPRDPMTPDEARRLLASHISIHYGVSASQLIEKEHKHSPVEQIHEFSFTSPDGAEYGGIVGSPEDPLECTRVWRKSSTPQARPEYSHMENE